MRLFHRHLPYSQAEIAEQISQVNNLRGDERDIANEILRFMLDANIRFMKGE